MLGAWVCVGVKENRDKDGVKTHNTTTHRYLDDRNKRILEVL